MNTIHAKQIAFHRKAQHLFITVFIDQDGLQKSGVHDEQSIKRLADRMDTLTGLELHVLK